MKKLKGKKLLSLIMAAVMVIGLLPVNAFASNGNQIMNGYFEVNAGGDATSHEGADPGVTQDGYTVNKSITRTGENAFDITLQVETQQTVKTNDIAVVLVIDTSNSMMWCAECGRENKHAEDCTHYKKYNNYVNETTQSRMAATIAAAKNFVDALAENKENGGKVYVSVVKFSTNASKVCNWTDVTNLNGQNSVKNAIGNLKADGGTNVDAGLTLAYNRLGMEDIKSASAKYTVLLTDGQPTYYYEGTSGNTENIGNAKGPGNAANTNTVNHAKDAATQVKTRSTLYTICFGAEDDICLEGQKIEVCEHCEKSKDKHNKVTLCKNCHQSWNAHKGVFNWCPTGGWSTWEGKTTYYCNGTSGNTYKGKIVENGNLTVGSFLDSMIATSSECAYNAKNTAALNEAFKNIASSAIEGSNGAGTQVLDPMGRFIQFGEIKSATGGEAVFNEESNTLIWALDPDKADKVASGDTTTYRFTLQYSITLDTKAQGFEENIYYPTNGYTRLKVPDGNDVAFHVPGVQGTVPDGNYTIEYYKWDKSTEAYPSEPTESTPGTAKLWTTVSAPNGYESKYSGDHYSFVGSETEFTQITVTPDPAQNVIRLYYKPDTAQITVNHYYRTDVTDVNGNTTIGEYGDPTTVYYTAYVGDRYPAEGEVPLYTEDGTYTLVTEESADRYIDEVQVSGNVINLYYVKTIDNREHASVTLQKNYETWEWQIVGGRYQLVQITDSNASTTETVLEDTRIPGSHSQLIADEEGYKIESITANGQTVSRDPESKEITFSLVKDVNPIVVNYKKIIDHRGTPVEVKVNHVYTNNIWSADGDKLVNNPNPNGVTGDTDTISMYVGETYDFTKDTVNDYELTYQGVTYSTHTTPDPIIVQAIQNDGTNPNVIRIDYTNNQYPDQATYTVTSYFRTWTSTIDPETGEVKWTSRVDYEDTVTYPTDSSTVYYADQTFTVNKNPYNRDGNYKLDGMKEYSHNESSADTITLDAGDENYAVYYFDDAGEQPQVGSVTVTHEYYENVPCVTDGGAIGSRRDHVGTTSETVYGAVGASYIVEAVTSFEGKEYELENSIPADVTYSSAGTTVVLRYIREGEPDLTPATLNVTHNYYVNTMTVQNGVAGYYNAPTFEGSSTDYVVKDVNGNVITDHNKLYVGMSVTVEPATVYGEETYTARSTNKTLIILEQDNTLVLNYDRYDPLDQVQVTVYHHYKDLVYSYVNGEESISESITTSPAIHATMYVGETYTAEPITNGYKLVSAKDGADEITPQDGKYTVEVAATGNTINFVYEKKTGDRKPVDVTVYHYYTEINWDGTKTGCGTTGYEAERETYHSYEGLTFTATPNYKLDDNGENGYTLVDQNAIPAFDSGLTITLQEGLNEIHLYYEKSIDTRVPTKVKVIHNYYARDTYTDDDQMTDADYIAQEGMEPEYRTERVYDTFEEGVWVGNSYEATMYNIVYFKDGDGEASIERTYELVNANPQNRTVDPIAKLNDDNTIPDGNVITFDLIREYSTDPGDATYTVVHEYYTNGSLSGSVTSTGTGKIGAVINASEIGKLNTYNGNTYSFTSASAESITLASGENTITFRYDRTTGGGGGGGGTTSYYKVTVHYLDADGNEIADSYVTPSIRQGGSWDVSDKQLETITVGDATYTFAYADGDELTGDNIRSDKVVNLYYEVETDIDDGETPLGPGPDGETGEPGDGGEVDIDDGETPLSPGPGGETDVNIEDGEVSQSSLPQTGAAMTTISPAAVVGTLGAAAIMAAAGVVYTIGRKKEDDMQ